MAPTTFFPETPLLGSLVVRKGFRDSYGLDGLDIPQGCLRSLSGNAVSRRECRFLVEGVVEDRAQGSLIWTRFSQPDRCGARTRGERTVVFNAPVKMAMRFFLMSIAVLAPAQILRARAQLDVGGPVPGALQPNPP